MAMNNSETQSAANLDHVDGVLNYLADRSEPVTYTYQPPPGVVARTGNYAKYSVPIHSARAIISQLSLDRQGFAVASHQTAVANFYDEKEVRAVYYPEVERLVKEVTAAVKVHVFDHNVRCRPMAKLRESSFGRSGGFASESIRDYQRVAADSWPGAGIAAGSVRRGKHGAGRLREARAALPRSRWRGILSRLQSQSSMVLHSKSEKRRSTTTQMLRFR